MDLRLLPDADGVIDLTTLLDDDSPLAAEFGNLSINSYVQVPLQSNTSWTTGFSTSTSVQGKTSGQASGQGNSGPHDEIKTRGRSIVASRLTSANRQPFMSAPYNYADNIPKPKVIYIKREEHANEMIDSLNGQVTPLLPFLMV
jgi:hypothetical protein